MDAHEQVADHVATSLVRTSLAGVDSHGFPLLPRILKRVEAGRSQLAKPASVRPGAGRGGVAVLDAFLAPGQHGCMAAADLAVEKATAHGIGYVSVHNSTHFGACLPYLERVTSEGMVAVCGSNSLRSMATFGARFANLGNNPMGFGAPRPTGGPLLFDFSCAVMSFGARNKLKAAGEPVPDGAFIKPEQPDMEDGVYEIAGNLEEVALPFGGFKGASVALMIETLAAVLGGGHFGKSTETRRDGAFLGPSHFVIAIDPESTGSSIAELGDAIQRFSIDVRSDLDDVRLPGDKAEAHRRTRAEEGIPVSGDLRTELEDWAKKLNVALPL